jgi:hypothetical protein
VTTGHDAGQLATRALNGLDRREARQVDEHVAVCATCSIELAELREAESVLRRVQPEALIDGPPPGGDLVLQLTLRQVRAQSAGRQRLRTAILVAAGLIAVGTAGGVGSLVGRDAAPDTAIVQPRLAAPGPTRTLSAADVESGARMTVTLIPAAGWTRLSTRVDGIPAGEHCRLVVLGADGGGTVAGSWVVSPQGAAEGTEVSGSAAVVLDAIAAVVVEDVRGRPLVTVRT